MQTFFRLPELISCVVTEKHCLLLITVHKAMYNFFKMSLKVSWLLTVTLQSLQNIRLNHLHLKIICYSALKCH